MTPYARYVAEHRELRPRTRISGDGCSTYRAVAEASGARGCGTCGVAQAAANLLDILVALYLPFESTGVVGLNALNASTA